MDVLNLGSINIDYVYRVPHLALPGQTVSAISKSIYTGGKGANQSVALAMAGAKVKHAGKIGEDGQEILQKLGNYGVDISSVCKAQGETGHAFIQVDNRGQNAIVVVAGTNRQITRQEVDKALKTVAPGTFLLLQNEISELPYIIEQGKEKGLKICFNPAPITPEVQHYPLIHVDMLILNQPEAEGLVGEGSTGQITSRLSDLLPNCQIVLTLGAKGAAFRDRTKELFFPAFSVDVVDVTGGGDVFIGYFLASYLEEKPVAECLRIACAASALCVSRPGAMESIPTKEEVVDFLNVN